MKNYPLMPADILLPKDNYETFAVIACDQFTSEADYWDGVEKIVGDKPSALRITLPEIYLGGDMQQKIDGINRNMTEYMQNGVFKTVRDKMVYVRRLQSDGRLRRGIVGVINLDDYDYHAGTKAKIRATEQTVLERIPPRVQIRKDAPLELPHVLLLIDDPDNTVIGPLENEMQSMEKAYDFELMQGGGHIEGYLTDERLNTQIGEALEKLGGGEDELLFAVGDGNHSLATAKECSKLSDAEAAGYALVEVVNIHDEAIEFEPIYRVLFGVSPKDFMAEMRSHFGEYDGEDKQVIEYVSAGENGKISVKPTSKLPVGTLQKYLDDYLKSHSDVKIDYIHGDDVVRSLCQKENTLGFIFDGMRKDELFDAIKQDGSLPRKTFSMGHARDKRYYIEARKIK